MRNQIPKLEIKGKKVSQFAIFVANQGIMPEAATATQIDKQQTKPEVLKIKTFPSLPDSTAHQTSQNQRQPR